MDLNRLYRALLVRRMEAVEMRRQRFLAGKLKSAEIDQADWNLIIEMDEWAQE